MQITDLQIRSVRCLAAVDIEGAGERNLIIGPNASGKSSVLEAIHLLGTGQSFRHRESRPVIRHGCDRATVFARLMIRNDAAHRLGVERGPAQFRARFDGEDVRRRSELMRALPVAMLPPNSQALLEGSSGQRRRWLDWGLFHVEPGYYPALQSYGLALRQRNAAVKQQLRTAARAYEQEMARHGQLLNEWRNRHVSRLGNGLRHWLAEFSWAESCELVLAEGSVEGIGLLEMLERSWPQDIRRGYTTRGPHTADFLVRAGSQPAARLLSRGQEKILTIALLLSQCELMRRAGSTPILLLDDLGAELDEQALEKVARSLEELALQSWITSTHTHAADLLAPHRMFHVEHGRVISAL